MKQRILLFAAVFSLVSFAAAQDMPAKLCLQCIDNKCSEDHATGGCNCTPATTLYNCVFPCLTPKEGSSEYAKYLAMLNQAHVSSPAQLHRTWENGKRITPSEIEPYSHVMALLLYAEKEQLWDRTKPCVSWNRGGTFTVSDGVVARWEASVEGNTVTYYITEQPDTQQPDKLVISRHGWRISKGDALVATGMIE